MTPQEFHAELKALVDAWCERRELALLRTILKGYPLVSGLTDELAELAGALKTIRAQHRALLIAGELDRVIDLQQFAESLVYKRG